MIRVHDTITTKYVFILLVVVYALTDNSHQSLLLDLPLNWFNYLIIYYISFVALTKRHTNTISKF